MVSIVVLQLDLLDNSLINQRLCRSDIVCTIKWLPNVSKSLWCLEKNTNDRKAQYRFYGNTGVHGSTWFRVGEHVIIKIKVELKVEHSVLTYSIWRLEEINYL